MIKQDIIQKLKQATLLGRGGAAFPTHLKWEIVKKAKAKKKYIVCNGAEGEPGVFKDGFILENYPTEVIEGVKLALQAIDHSHAFIYLRHDYYQKFNNKLKKIIGHWPIKIVKKVGGYLSGEETVVCNVIEGKKPEPRIRPPFPCYVGIFGQPTLVNNLETFYYAVKIAKGEYKQTRFYSISGAIKNPGVYELPESWSVSKILKATNNLPRFDFFVQVGGGVSGEILLPKELNKKVGGQGAIVVYNRKKTNLNRLMKKWVDFYLAENCDKCAPCREGVYRLAEMLKSNKVDRKLLDDLFFVLQETSFCALGKSVVVPFKSLINKVF